MDHLLRATARAEARHFWFKGFRAFVTPLIQVALTGRSEVRILDCGCGTGANVSMLGRFGRAYGFDLTETGLKLGLDAGRNRLVRATVTAVPTVPDVGDKLLIEGVGSTVKLAPLLATPPTVTTTLPAGGENTASTQ